jgi:hypothetical protein
MDKKLMDADCADALDAMAAPLSKLDALYIDKIDHGWACELMPLGKVWPGSNSAEADARRPLLNRSGIPTTL